MIWLYSKTLVCGLRCNIVAREVMLGEELTIQRAEAALVGGRRRMLTDRSSGGGVWKRDGKFSAR